MVDRLATGAGFMSFEIPAFAGMTTWGENAAQKMTIIFQGSTEPFIIG
jgi:hypothetical protein